MDVYDNRQQQQIKVHECLDLLKKFEAYSGLKLNYTKTEILLIGKPKDTKKLLVKIVDSTCSLGIWYYKNIETIINSNHTIKLAEIERALNNWQKRNLTLLGKSTVVKTLIVPKINHFIAGVTSPEWLVIKYNTWFKTSFGIINHLK